MMNGRRRHGASPCYIDGREGRLFAVHHPAQREGRPRRGFLYIPPFAEEMNCARRTAALQARALSAAGFDVLLLDPFGTGDSEGDFGDASWNIWLADVAAAAQWLRAHGVERIGLWGLRLGALLAAAAVADTPEQYSRLLLWQPVVDGRAMLTQFLRIRVAAAMRGDGARETTDSLRAAIASGEAVEVAGYAVNDGLAQAMDRLRIDAAWPVPRAIGVDVLEIGQAATIPVQRLVQHWREAGVVVAEMVVPGEHFWAIPEAAPATGLIGATTSVVQTWTE